MSWRPRLTRRALTGSLMRGLSLALLPAALFVAGCNTTTLGGSTGRPGKVQVALLVPSGATDTQVAGIADSMVNAANLAVDSLEQPLVEVKIYPTAGEAQIAAASAQQAIAEGADVILGPLFAQAAAAVGQVASATNTAVMAFSNNTDVAGGNVFVMGNSFENTANQLGRYAANHGVTKIFVIHADTPAEQFAQRAIGRGLTGTGAQIVGSASFEYSVEGMVAALPLIAEQVRASGASALFLTTNTDAGLRELTNLLPDHNLGPDQYQYIGLGRWDRPPSAASLPGLQGGWFAIPDPGATAEFNARYIEATETAPFPLAQLAFDGINAIAVQAGKAGPSAVKPDALATAGSFVGVAGTFAYQANGTVQREMTIATIRNNSLAILQQARTPLALPGS